MIDHSVALPKSALILPFFIFTWLVVFSQPDIYLLREGAQHRLNLMKDSLSVTTLPHLMQLNACMDSLIMFDSLALISVKTELAELEAERASQVAVLAAQVDKLSNEKNALQATLDMRTYVLGGIAVLFLLFLIIAGVLYFRLRKQKIHNDYIIQEMKRSTRGSSNQEIVAIKTSMAEMEKELIKREKLIQDFEETIRKEIEFRKKMESDYRMMIDQLRKKKGY